MRFLFLIYALFLLVKLHNNMEFYKLTGEVISKLILRMVAEKKLFTGLKIGKKKQKKI